MSRKKNPLLEKKYWEGYKQGKKDGISQSINFFADKMIGLEDVPGIGEKTIKKIINQLGTKYFK